MAEGNVNSGGQEIIEKLAEDNSIVTSAKPPAPPQKSACTNSALQDFLLRKGAKKKPGGGRLTQAPSAVNSHGSVPSLPETSHEKTDNNNIDTAGLAMGKKSQNENEVPSIIYWHKYGNMQDLSRSMDSTAAAPENNGVEASVDKPLQQGKAASLLDTSQSACDTDVPWVRMSDVNKMQEEYDNVDVVQKENKDSSHDLDDAVRREQTEGRTPFLFSDLADCFENRRTAGFQHGQQPQTAPLISASPNNRYFNSDSKLVFDNKCDEAKLNTFDRARTEPPGPSSRSNFHAPQQDPLHSSLSQKVQELEKAFYSICNSSLVDEDKLSKLQEMDQALVYLVDRANVPCDVQDTTQLPQSSVQSCEENVHKIHPRSSSEKPAIPPRPPGLLANRKPQTELRLDQKVQISEPAKAPSPGYLSACDRPKSFLNEEMEEFERIFSELFFSKHKRMSNIAQDMVKSQDGQVLQTKPQEVAGAMAMPMATAQRKSSVSSAQGACAKVTEPVDTDTWGRPKGTPPPTFQRSVRAGGLRNPAQQDRASYRIPRQSVKMASSKRRSLHEDSLPKLTPTEETELEQKMSRLQSSLKRVKECIAEEGDKLFSDLLDDLDNISHANTDSARRRRKARDLFSDWVFSSEPKTPEASDAMCSPRHVLHASGLSNVCSSRLDSTPPKDDLQWQRRRQLLGHGSEDDTDSGYYTNENSLKGMSKRPPGEYTLTRDDLRKRIEAFNNNNHGLIMSLQPDSNTFQGFIRVHMNLIRPINMSLTVRPPSIYDALGQEITEEGHEETAPLDDTQIASFYLPKDTSKVIHIRSDTSTQEVIKTLLSKYRITDNPRKFALYEKDLSRNGVMRKLTSDELPLPLCLSWEAEGLDERKFVLQENDTGDVIWEAFSLPELENFLRILKKEEEEYVEQVKAKYHLMKIHMSKRCSEILKLNQQGGKGSPQKGKAASGAGAQSGKAPKGTGSPKSGSPHQSAKRGVTGREGAVNQSSASADSPTQQSRTSKTDKKDKEIFV